MKARRPKMVQGTRLTETVPVLASLETGHVGREGIRMVELHVQRTGEEVHSGLGTIEVVELGDPEREVSHAGDNSPAED
jgi:hypothetical protein